jgi:SAM-dependent methyltransferase
LSEVSHQGTLTLENTPLPAAGSLTFECNLCGTHNHVDLAHLDREAPSCSACGSNLRFRSIVDALSQRLFNASLPIHQFPGGDSRVGIGMSDASTYADRLAQVLRYQNTFYHTEPLFDITKPAAEHLGRYDFVITSDVFEHVAPPVAAAFTNLFNVLKPGGFVIFSVPFGLDADTLEHFPRLNEWSIETTSSGGHQLRNRTVEGEEEVYDQLIFHGGPGTTLEMRLFSWPALQREFSRAGFIDLRLHDQPNFAAGVYWREPWSITLSAMRPLTGD